MLIWFFAFAFCKEKNINFAMPSLSKLAIDGSANYHIKFYILRSNPIVL